jgi:superfamily II DNA or RNA helicase
MRELTIFRIGDLENYIESLELNPEHQLSAVMSLESLRGRSSVQDLIEASGIEFDLVIIDEAHALRNKGTQGHRLAQLVADNSKFLVFLSATPLNLGKEDLFNLMTLLEPHQYPTFQVFREQVEPNKHLLEARRRVIANDSKGAVSELEIVPTLQFGGPVAMRPTFRKLYALAQRTGLDYSEKAQVNSYVNELNTLSTVLNRTRKKDTKDFQATRRSENISVEWTKDEWDFYEAIRQHFIEKAKKSGLPRGFILQMPLRQTCSSIAVMANRLRDKKLLPSELLDEDEELEIDESELQALTAAGGSVSINARAPKVDSKLEAFLGLMHRLKKQGLKHVLIFTFFRGTVTYLEEQLNKAGFSSKGIHGGISPQDRFQLIEDFRSGDFNVMIANQVGAEGLDFEFCNVLVNYDLPWNPMQVEQRIGRLDRFGQKNDVIHIYNLVVPGTIESDIFQRLYDRIQIFTNTIGDLEEILQDRLEDLSDLIIDPSLTPEELQKKVDNVGISIELERQTKQNVEEERQHLSILDQLEVEGLSESGPKKGRYMSPAEILGHLEFIASEYGASVTPLASDFSLIEFRGTEALAIAAGKSKMLDVGSELGHALHSHLRSGEPLTFVLDSRILTRPDSPRGPTEIVSARHPLIRMAQERLRETNLLDGRYSDLVIKSEEFSGQYLAKWMIFESFGVDHKTELWVTAIDLSSGERDQEVEDFLLANAELIREAWVRPTSLVSDLDIDALKAVEAIKFQRERDERQLENEAIIGARLEAERAVEERKLVSNEARLAKDIENGRPEKILQLTRGKIDRSKARLIDLEDEFEAKRLLSAQTHNVALAKVSFASTFPTKEAQ